MSVRSGSPAPYGPPAAVLTVINGFRDRGLATPFTADVLIRAGISESLVPRVLKSLEGLDLIDQDGNPTGQMEGLRRATTEEFPTRLADIVRSAYAEVFQFTDPAKDDATRVADAFRAYEPVGQRGRMVTLFMGMCEAAGIVAPSTSRPPAGTAARARDSGKKRTRTSTRAGGAAPGAARSVPPQLSDNTSVPAAIMGLLSTLPPEGTPWPSARRTALVTAFGHVLDFCYPDVPVAPPPSDDEAA